MKSIRLTIRKMLQNLNIGTKFRFAENGKDGIEVLRNTRSDLAIIDWNMPVMNGIDMLKEIRSDIFLRNIPVIMVTTESERDIVSEVAETEIDGYLLKPLTLSALDEKIKIILEEANHPSPAKIHRNKARDLEEKGEINAAIEQIKIALKHKPSASRLIRQLALLHFKIKDTATAEKCLLKAVAINKQDIISRAYLADFYVGKNEFEKGAEHYLQILSLSSRYNYKAFKLGVKLLQEGFESLALDIFPKVIARSKKQNTVKEKIINACMANGEFEYPRELLEQSIKENPSNYDMNYKAGLVSREAGDWEKALNYFITVDCHVRSHVDAKFQIAQIYYENRKILQADEYLNQIIRINPKHEKALALRAKI